MSETLFKSTLALPTTAMRGRFAIIIPVAPARSNGAGLFEVRKAEFSQPLVACQPFAAASRATTEGTGVHREAQRVSLAVPDESLCPLWVTIFLAVKSHSSG